MYTNPKNSSVKLVIPAILFIVFVVLTVAAIVGALQWFKHIESLEGYVVAASSQRLSTNALVTNATSAAGGNEESFAVLSDRRAEVTQYTDLLNNGSEEEGIAKPPKSLQNKLQEIEGLTLELDGYVETIESNQSSIVTLSELSDRIGAALPNLDRIFSQVSQRTEELGLDSVQTYYLTRQLYLTERIKLSKSNLLSGGSAMALAVDRLTQDVDELKLILDAMVIGSFSLGIKPIHDVDAKTQLVEASSIVTELTQVVTEILNMVGDVLPALQSIEKQNDQASPMAAISTSIDSKLQELVNSYRDATSQLKVGRFTVGPRELIALASAALATLFLLFWIFHRRQKKRVDLMSFEHDENESAIHNLIVGMNSVSGSNINEKVVRSEGNASTLSEAINAGVVRLRGVADAAINKADSVSRLAEGVRSNLLQLTDNVGMQGRRSQNASKSADSVASLFSDLTQFVTDARSQNQSLSATVSAGNDVVRRTEQSIDSARERMSATAKRLRRLDENSQAVGKLVETIEDIADENNIMVLNAAMQAASAGESGQGLAILADDVQRLAERSANTTRRIDVLIQTIQADTTEAVSAMETTRTEIHRNSEIAEETKQILRQIEESAKMDNSRADLLSQSVNRNVAESEELSTILAQIYEESESSISETTAAESSVNNLLQQLKELRDIHVGSGAIGHVNIEPSAELTANSTPGVSGTLTHGHGASD